MTYYKIVLSLNNQFYRMTIIKFNNCVDKNKVIVFPNGQNIKKEKLNQIDSHTLNNIAFQYYIYSSEEMLQGNKEMLQGNKEKLISRMNRQLLNLVEHVNVIKEKSANLEITEKEYQPD